MPKLVKNKQLVVGDDWLNQTAVNIPVDCDLDTLDIDYKNTPLITIEFTLFMDGRAFSIARTLREQFDYTGELRALGNFIPDQLHYLSRCGFDAFQFADEVEDSTIQECLNAFSEHYQAAVDDPQPLFRRRA